MVKYRQFGCPQEARSGRADANGLRHGRFFFQDEGRSGKECGYSRGKTGMLHVRKRVTGIPFARRCEIGGRFNLPPCPLSARFRRNSILNLHPKSTREPAIKSTSRQRGEVKTKRKPYGARSGSARAQTPEKRRGLLPVRAPRSSPAARKTNRRRQPKIRVLAVKCRLRWWSTRPK